MKGFLIHSPVEYYADQTPDSPSLRLQGQVLSYAELNAAANQLAYVLIENGASVEDRVGIFLHKSFEMGFAIYGALKAGCVFVPLDPFMPAERLEFILSDCNIQHLVSSDLLLDTVSQISKKTDLTIYGVEEKTSFRQMSWQDIGSRPVTNPDLVLIDQNLGYIMYTSGSTGEPKGMMHTHLGSITYARWGAEHVDIQPHDRVASHAPLHFDLSIFDFFSTAQRGASVVLIPEPVTRFPASWTKAVEDEQISIVFTVPYTLMTMFEQGAMDQRNLSSLRWILFGGDLYPPRQLKELMCTLPGVNFTNVYGPAEAPSCTCHDIKVSELDNDEPLSIGVVSANSTDLIIDANDMECADGVAGELCIRSSTLTRGYWNRPDLNARAYLLQESHGQFPHVYFRTGDRVVRREDGLLRFLGRMDRMIKTRGHRVELDEVEAAIASHEAVFEIAAIVIPDDHGSHTIHAVVTINEAHEVDVAELNRYARKKLPPYAVPRTISLQDELPHISTGKIDRKELTQQWLRMNQP